MLARAVVDEANVRPTNTRPEPLDAYGSILNGLKVWEIRAMHQASFREGADPDYALVRITPHHTQKRILTIYTLSRIIR